MIQWLMCWLNFHGRDDWVYTDGKPGYYRKHRTCRYCGRTEALHGYSDWRRVDKW